MHPIGSRPPTPITDQPSTDASDLGTIEPRSVDQGLPGAGATEATPNLRDRVSLGVSPVDNVLDLLGAENVTPEQRAVVEAAITEFQGELDEPSLVAELGRLRRVPSPGELNTSSTPEADSELFQASINFALDLPVGVALSPEGVEELRTALEQGGAQIPENFADLPLRELGPLGADVARQAFENLSGPEQAITAAGAILAAAAMGSENLERLGISPEFELSLGESAQVSVQAGWGPNLQNPHARAEVSVEGDVFEGSAGVQLGNNGNPTTPPGPFGGLGLTVPVTGGVQLGASYNVAGVGTPNQREQIAASINARVGDGQVRIAFTDTNGQQSINARYTLAQNDTEFGIEANVPLNNPSATGVAALFRMQL
ncbi:MAG: hypothetical protein AAFP04_12830 [Myxococcota bacterium]